MLNEVEHLGHIIDKHGIRVNVSKVEAIKNAPAPTNVKQLQSFIGCINYYSKFIPNMASICKPLYALLEKSSEWCWQQKDQDAFDCLKLQLTSAPVLVIYDQTLPVKLDCDASSYGIGAILSNVYPNGDEKPIAFASRTLNTSERNYSQVDKEATAIVFGVKKINQYLFGRHFTLSCDNKALCSIFGKKNDTPVLAASRLVRWSLILNAYDFDIEFRSSEKNSNADMLSRLPLKESIPVSKDNMLYSIQIAHMPVEAAEVKRETSKDVILQAVMNCLQNNYWSTNEKVTYKPYYLKRHELFIENGILMWGLRVVVPNSLRIKIIKELHWQHPGIVRMKALCRIHAWYPNIDKDIEQLVEKCCQCKKVENAPPKDTTHPWAWPSKPMDRVHIDYFGPFYGKTYLILVDSYSKWCEVEVKKQIHATSTIDTCRLWFSKYGLPNQVVTDNGTQFTSNQFSEFCKRNGIKHITSAPFHQSSNGQAERFVQTINKGLKMNNIEDGDAQLKLDNYLFAYRSTPTCTGQTPAELFLGRKLKCRLDCMKPDITYSENKFISRSFNVGDAIYIRSYNSREKWIVGIVKKTLGDCMYEVQVGDKIVRRHIDQIIKNNTKLRNMNANDNYEFMSYDFPDEHLPRLEPGPQRRRNTIRKEYPRRIRRPISRYGMS